MEGILKASADATARGTEQISRGRDSEVQGLHFGLLAHKATVTQHQRRYMGFTRSMLRHCHHMGMRYLDHDNAFPHDHPSNTAPLEA